MALNYKEQLQHPLWIKKRNEILIRDNDTCQICNDKDHKHEVHHLCYLPDLLLWEYDNELMVTVCGKHHDQLNFDMPKVAGLIAFESLRMKIDLSYLLELLQQLKNDKF